MILTDAEYRQLSPAEQSDYWRGRYYDMQEQADRIMKENVRLRYALIAVGETTKRALSTAE